MKRILTGICCVLICSITHAFPDVEGIKTYQKNIHLSPERKQRLADDIDRYRNADNLWDVLRQEFTLPHYEDNPQVQEKIAWYMNHQDFLIRSAARAAPYLYFILQQVRKRHLPGELVLLPIIESAYNPFALNASSGAAGIWQMMSATASGYGIRQNGWYDGRRDVVASTQAALNHLAYLRSFFQGNWLLALAAYDAGEGKVLMAMRKNVFNGESIDYWSLPLVQETRDYIPQLLALATIISHPDLYPIAFPPIQNAPYLAEIDLGIQIDLQRAASLAGLSLKELKQLNSGFSRSAIGPRGPYKLVLPIENVEQFTENLAMHKTERLFAENRPEKTSKTGSLSRTILESKPEPIAVADSNEIPIDHYTLQPGDTLYMVRKNDSLEKIANHFHTSTKTLIAINHVRTVYTGQKIIIPTHPTNTDTTQKYELAPGDTIYMVRHGDTIEKIAGKFHTTPEAVRLVNLLAENKLQEGDRLLIPTHA